ncbi:unnamed protein product, partial [Ilex paraguariensis]
IRVQNSFSLTRNQSLILKIRRSSYILKIQSSYTRQLDEIINYVDDEEYGVRLFWQPPLNDGDDVDPEKVQFLPLGFDEFYGRDVSMKKENILMRLVTAVENACKPMFDKLEKWTEEKKKAGEMKMELLEKEIELVEAELCLKEAIEDMDEELKRMQKEEEKKVEKGLQDEEDIIFPEPDNQFEKTEADEEEDEGGGRGG